jgi:2',3'-cyclic-nucleotide 2'-phosphodiesterase (5'-nucleotidase family)
MGGFARRMSYWNAFEREYPGRAALRLDAGSLFSVGAAESFVANRWMLEGTVRSRLDALNLTAWDLPVWQEMGDMAKVGQIPPELLRVPIVSANVKIKARNFPQVQRFLIKNVVLDGISNDRISVGITGLMSDPERRIDRDQFEVEDPVAAAIRVVGELGAKSDYRVVLTDMDIGSAMSLAIRVPGIDLIVVAHDYPSLSEDQQVGQTLLVVTVNEGRALHEVRLNFRHDSDDVKLQTRVIPLDDRVPDDRVLGDLIQRAQAAVDEFKKKQ